MGAKDPGSSWGCPGGVNICIVFFMFFDMVGFLGVLGGLGRKVASETVMGQPWGGFRAARGRCGPAWGRLGSLGEALGSDRGAVGARDPGSSWVGRVRGPDLARIAPAFRGRGGGGLQTLRGSR